MPLEAQACGRPVVALESGGALETVIDGETGMLVEPGDEALADGMHRAAATAWDPDASAGTPSASAAIGLPPRSCTSSTRRMAAPRRASMVRRYNRLLVAFHVVTDALLGMVAFVLAYFVRFETGFIPDAQGAAAARAVPRRPAVHRGDRAARLPPAGPLSPAPRAVAHRRLLQRPGRQHHRRRLRRGRRRCMSQPMSFRKRARSAPTRSRSRSGASSCCSTSPSAICRASSCAKRSSGAGSRASGCGAS